MRRRLSSALLIVMGLQMGAIAQDSVNPTFVIDRPTVIAFFAHMTDFELDKDPDMNEALSDFQLYASESGPRLKKVGVDFEVASTASFRIKIGTAIRSFKAGKIRVGYYFVTPEKQPKVEYGVMTDDDILATARKYFELPIERP